MDTLFSFYAQRIFFKKNVNFDKVEQNFDGQCQFLIFTKIAKNDFDKNTPYGPNIRMFDL